MWYLIMEKIVWHGAVTVLEDSEVLEFSSYEEAKEAMEEEMTRGKFDHFEILFESEL